MTTTKISTDDRFEGLAEYVDHARAAGIALRRDGTPKHGTTFTFGDGTTLVIYYPQLVNVDVWTADFLDELRKDAKRTGASGKAHAADDRSTRRRAAPLVERGGVTFPSRPRR